MGVAATECKGEAQVLDVGEAFTLLHVARGVQGFRFSIYVSPLKSGHASGLGLTSHHAYDYWKQYE